jgi:chorismate--pyruvate lyase
LGAVLFADPSMRREEVEVACIRPGQYAFDVATSRLDSPPGCIWGRRSVFFLEREPLLVSEVFLPALVPCDT